MEDLKPDRDVAMLNGGGCSPCEGLFINLATLKQGEKPFFWRGGMNERLAKVSATCKQYFNGTDFSNQQFFVVTGSGGTLKHNPANGAIGINDDYINAGESVTLKLSDCMNGFDLRSFHITLHGARSAYATICLFKGETCILDIDVRGIDHPNTPGKGSYNFPVEFHARNPLEYFDKMVIKTTSGRILWKGYQPNFNQALYYPATYFALAPTP